MKKHIFLCFCLYLFGSVLGLRAYVEKELAFCDSAAPAYLKRFQGVSLERSADNSFSVVKSINGIDAFNQHVVQQSLQQPVIMAVYVTQNQNCAAMRSVYQQIAHQMVQQHVDKIGFVSLQLDVDPAGSMAGENRQIVEQLMAHAGLQKLECPAVFFFKHGNFYSIDSNKALVLQGFNNKDHLVRLLNDETFIAMPRCMYAQNSSPILERIGLDDTRLNKKRRASYRHVATAEKRKPFFEKIIDFLKSK